MVVYCLTSPSFKNYVGQTCRTLNERISGHCWKAKNRSDRKLYAAIRKYGIENFDKTILLECPKEESDFWERYYIKLFDSVNNGYNHEIGGRCRKEVTTDTRLKLSLALTGKTYPPHTEGHRKKQSESLKRTYMLNPRCVLPNEEIMSRYKSGLSCKKLAKIYDVTPVTILNRLRKLGVEIRHPGRQNKE